APAAVGAVSAGGALAKLEKLHADPKHTILESKGGLAGFGRDGNVYYFADGNKLVAFDSATGKRTDFADLEKWNARAIRVAGNELILLSDLEGAGWIAVYDKNSQERLRRQRLPRPINHAANPSAAIAPDGRIVFPESKYGKADFVVSLSPQFEKMDFTFDVGDAPRGFKAERVAIRG